MNREKSDNTMKGEPIDVDYRQHVMGWGKVWVWDNLDRNKKHQETSLVRTLYLNNQIEIFIKQLEKPGFKGRKEIET